MLWVSYTCTKGWAGCEGSEPEWYLALAFLEVLVMEWTLLFTSLIALWVLKHFVHNVHCTEEC